MVLPRYKSHRPVFPTSGMKDQQLLAGQIQTLWFVGP